MRTKRMISVIAFGILALIMTHSLFAQRGNSTGQLEAAQAEASSEAIGIVGTRVSNEAGDNLGAVVNVLVAPTSGRVTALVIGIGGVFGYGSYNYEVPWKRVQFTDEAEVQLDVSRDRVSSEFPAYKPNSPASPKDQLEGSEANERVRSPDSGDRDESPPEKQE